MKIYQPLAAAVGLVAATALTACSPGSPDGDSTPASAAEITLVTGVASSPFYEAMACGAESAADDRGVALTVQAPSEWGATGMLPVLDAVAAAQPDALLVVPTDPEALDERLMSIADAGAVIVELDQRVTDESIAAASIASSDEEGGTLAAETMAELIGEEGKVLVISSPPGSDQQSVRADAFSARIADYPGIEDLGAQYALSDVALAASIVTATLAAHPDLAGIFVTNDINTTGALTGLEEAGALGDVTLVAYDAADTQITALQEGTISALIAQDPFGEGVLGVETALTALDGGEVERQISIPLRVLEASDPDGVEEYLAENSGTC